MSNTEYVEYSTMSEIDKKLYRYFWVYEEWVENIKIIEPNITDVIKHFTRKFPIYNASFSTSVDWWVGGDITFKDWFIPDIRNEYTTEYIHDRSLLKQSDTTKQFIVWIAESVLWYWFEEELNYTQL